MSEQAEQIVDGTVEEETPRREIEVVMQPKLAVTPSVKAGELVERLSVIEDAMKTAMKVDVDYGRIPGIDKPSLFKPGAEKLSVLFQLDVQLVNEKVWGPEDHLTVVSHATVFHAPTGSRLGYGEGICTTREKKYGKRKLERVCPDCGKPAVIKGKQEYGGGWLCFKKKDGCGAKWPDGAEVIESQQTGEIDNPELPDTWNTVVKMAEKRARVDAVLAVTGASALFTQDVEDSAPPADAAHNQASTASSRPSGTSRSSSRPTDKQIDYLGRLLRERPDVTADDAVVMQEWARERLSGGREGSCWELSERLKNGGERADAAIKDLAEQVAEWQRQQTDVPADQTDLFPPVDLTW